jgi:hypothetical protein
MSADTAVAMNMHINAAPVTVGNPPHSSPAKNNEQVRVSGMHLIEMRNFENMLLNESSFYNTQ